MLPLLLTLVFVAAVLYSAVGHGGASGYLAAMALCGTAPAVMRPTALALNVLVAGVAAWRFARAGLVPWRLLLPLVVASVPMAYLGGRLDVSPAAYQAALGAVLLFAAWRLTVSPGAERPVRARPPDAALIGIGAALGLLAGLTGVGGGIFLSPLLIMTGWAAVRPTSGASAVFIVVNSLAGLVGVFARGGSVPVEAAWLAPAALAGGVLGTWLGVSRLPSRALRRTLALVLVIAGAKLLYDALA